MGLAIVFLLACYALIFGEIFIVLWFFHRLSDLKHNKTDFKVSLAIPLGYLIYGFGFGFLFFVLIDFRAFTSGEPTDLSIMLKQYLIMATLINLTTPLFPLMAHLKRTAKKHSSSPDQNNNLA